jgi:hypothetical protein
MIIDEQYKTIVTKEDIPTVHTKYARLASARMRCNDVFEGQDTIHAKGPVYLPKLTKQTDEMYEAYKLRTRFFNVFKRTVRGLKGVCLRKDAKITSEAMPEQWLQDITLTGQSMYEYIDNVISEMLITTTAGTLVEYDEVVEGMTEAEKNNRNLRPYFVFFKAGEIVDWDYTNVNGILTFNYIKFRRDITKRKPNSLKKSAEKEYIILLLEDVDGLSCYRYIKYETNAGELDLIKDTFPEKDGKPIGRIPFFLHGEFELPIMYDLALMNISHYQLKADHRHFLHFACAPTPVIKGVAADDPNRPKTIGPEEFIFIEDPTGDASYMEPTGAAIGHVNTELQKIEEDMAFLGASMLVSDSNAQETATKALFRNAAETANLVTIINDANEALTAAIQFAMDWEGFDPSGVEIELSKDFNPTKMTAQEITTYVSAWQARAISKRTLHENLQEGEIIDSVRDFEEEQELISTGE